MYIIHMYINQISMIFVINKSIHANAFIPIYETYNESRILLSINKVEKETVII